MNEGLCLDRSALHRIGGLSHRGDTLAQAIASGAGGDRVRLGFTNPSAARS